MGLGVNSHVCFYLGNGTAQYPQWSLKRIFMTLILGLPANPHRAAISDTASASSLNCRSGSDWLADVIRGSGDTIITASQIRGSCAGVSE